MRSWSAPVGPPGEPVSDVATLPEWHCAYCDVSHSAVSDSAVMPVFVVGSDQIQPASAAVSAEGVRPFAQGAPAAKRSKSGAKSTKWRSPRIRRQITSLEQVRVGTVLRIISH
jgi:hypothetical protein